MHAGPWMGLSPGHCGCGCIGEDHAELRLKHYQEHLKAELKSVERQIAALQKTKK
jgi:hypothetical protein